MFSQILQTLKEKTRDRVCFEDSCKFTVQNYTTKKDLAIGVRISVNSGDRCKKCKKGKMCRYLHEGTDQKSSKNKSYIVRRHC